MSKHCHRVIYQNKFTTKVAKVLSGYCVSEEVCVGWVAFLFPEQWGVQYMYISR